MTSSEQILFIVVLAIVAIGVGTMFVMDIMTHFSSREYRRKEKNKSNKHNKN